MINFQYKDIEVQFQSWYDAASWFHFQWENNNSSICHIIDSSSSYFLDFTAWVNDNYTAYDILSRCGCDDLLYEDLKDKYIYELAEDLEDDVYDFCKYFKDDSRKYPEPTPGMKYFKITYSCGCGENEAYIETETLDNAWKTAYEAAVEDYRSYEGYHGVRDIDQIAEELFGDDCEEFDSHSLTDEQWEEVNTAYEEAIEDEIDYSAEEITFEEYMEGLKYGE